MTNRPNTLAQANTRDGSCYFFPLFTWQRDTRFVTPVFGWGQTPRPIPQHRTRTPGGVAARSRQRIGATSRQPTRTSGTSPTVSVAWPFLTSTFFSSP